MHHPTTIHWQAIKRIVRYLMGSITQSVHFHPDFSLHAYADYAGDIDDRRSTSGFVFFSAPISFPGCQISRLGCPDLVLNNNTGRLQLPLLNSRGYVNSFMIWAFLCHRP